MAVPVLPNSNEDPAVVDRNLGKKLELLLSGVFSVRSADPRRRCMSIARSGAVGRLRPARVSARQESARGDVHAMDQGELDRLSPTTSHLYHCTVSSFPLFHARERVDTFIPDRVTLPKRLKLTPDFAPPTTSKCNGAIKDHSRRFRSPRAMGFNGDFRQWEHLLRMGDKRTARLRCHAPARYKASASRPRSSTCWVDGGPLEPVAVVESAASCAPQRVSRTSGGAVDRRAGFPLRQLEPV
jgi:hypothetical protein